MILRLRAGVDWTPYVWVDVNQNHVIDANIDVAYINSGSRPCFQYLLSYNRTTQCGVFKSMASLQVTREPSGLSQSTTWTIPKTELNTGGTSVWLVVHG